MKTQLSFHICAALLAVGSRLWLAWKNHNRKCQVHRLRADFRDRYQQWLKWRIPADLELATHISHRIDEIQGPVEPIKFY